MVLDADKIVRLFELCQTIVDVQHEIPTLNGAMLDTTDRAVQLEMAEQLRPSLLTTHAATLRELAKLLQ